MTRSFDRPRWTRTPLGMLGLFFLLGGCTQHTVKVEPIQVNMNVRADVYLHVDQELDEFFAPPSSPAASSTHTPSSSPEKTTTLPATR